MNIGAQVVWGLKRQHLHHVGPGQVPFVPGAMSISGCHPDAYDALLGADH